MGQHTRNQRTSQTSVQSSLVRVARTSCWRSEASSFPSDRQLPVFGRKKYNKRTYDSSQQQHELITTTQTHNNITHRYLPLLQHIKSGTEDFATKHTNLERVWVGAAGHENPANGYERGRHSCIVVWQEKKTDLKIRRSTSETNQRSAA